MAQGIIFAYSYNKFHATLTTMAQNTISVPTCLPETRFCCLKICGWDSGQPFVKSPGSSNTRPPCTYMKGKFPAPVNCLSVKFPGESRGGGDGYSRNWLMHNPFSREFRNNKKKGISKICRERYQSLATDVIVQRYRWFPENASFIIKANLYAACLKKPNPTSARYCAQITS
jgi:hypothetical protein